MTTATITKTDEQIQKDVIAELKWDARLQPNEIGVIVKDGVVTLTGWVDSYLKKWSAEETALRVEGVKAVANEIEVRLPRSAESPDPDIAEAAVRMLEWDATVGSRSGARSSGSTKRKPPSAPCAGWSVSGGSPI